MRLFEMNTRRVIGDMCAFRRALVMALSIWSHYQPLVRALTPAPTTAPTLGPSNSDTVSISVDFLVSVGSVSSVTAAVFRTALFGKLAGATASTDLTSFVLPSRRRLEGVGTGTGLAQAEGDASPKLSATLPQGRELVTYAVSFNVLGSLATFGFADANAYEVAHYPQ